MTDILKPEEIGALMGTAAENGAHLQDLYDKLRAAGAAVTGGHLAEGLDKLQDVRDGLRAAQPDAPPPGFDEDYHLFDKPDAPPPSVEFGEALHKAQSYAQAAKQAATDAQTAAAWCEDHATRYPGPDYNGAADDGDLGATNAPRPKKPLASALQEEDGSWSIRRLVFAASFLLVAILCLASPWLPIQDNTKTVALALIGAAFTSVTAGRFAEALDR